MSTGHSPKFVSQLKKTRKYRDLARKTSRKMSLERLEDRRVMATGPQLVTIINNANGNPTNDVTDMITGGSVFHSAPRGITLRFGEGQTIDAATIANGVKITRAGGDGSFGQANDVVVTPGYMGIENSTREVVIRFAETLPDDAYRITIVGAGTTPLKDSQGNAFNSGVNQSIDFKLDLGAKVVAVVPQPITRTGNVLSQSASTVDVYFNQDTLNQASAQNPIFYRLTNQATGVTVNPTGVVYSSATNKATLTFGITLDGNYKLAVGTDTGSFFTTFNNIPVGSDVNSSFATAQNIGNVGVVGTQIGGAITAQPYNIMFPGSGDDPGHRDIPFESHLNGGPDTAGGSSVFFYNFRSDYGFDPNGNPLQNAITETQKQRAREIFELYSRYLGVQFVESDGSGLIIATGDLRAIDPNAPINGASGMAGGVLAVMNGNQNWGESEYGGGWFNTAMHEIGHLLGLGHTYDLPDLTIQGGAETPGVASTAEPVFPGTADVVHGQALYRPDSRDIDLYKFTVTEKGRFRAETIAERMGNSSLLNTVLTLYRETTDGSGRVVREIVSRNDDYYSSDSYIDLDVEPGTYYIMVNSSGMTGIDPTILDSGLGGRSDGLYELKVSLTPPAAQSIVDLTGTAFDGNSDNKPGGTYDFYFRATDTAHSVFVDKAYTGGGSDGTLAKPYTKISDALAAIQAVIDPIVGAGGVVPYFNLRIVGNGGTDGLVSTPGDNKPYIIGKDNADLALADGAEFKVPTNVNVMIDAGAILKFSRANIDAGSNAQGIDRSGGSIQVFGTPLQKVWLTSYNNDTLGGDSNGPQGPANPGDWGGIVFRDDSDMELNRDGSNNVAPVYLNYVNNALITYGGGEVIVDSIRQRYSPVYTESARPAITYNTITQSADAAISSDPNSFSDLNDRFGPDVHGNVLNNNTVNGLFVRIRTQFGSPVDYLDVTARWDDTDITYVVSENLHFRGTPSGPYLNPITGVLDARIDARLKIDPGVIVKFEGSRIEARVGTQLIAEGTAAEPIVMTSIRDDRFGGSGTFDAGSDGFGGVTNSPAAGQWGGLFFAANSSGSIDNARVFYGGGVTPIEGNFATFNVIEVHQADVRIAETLFQYNSDGTGVGGNRTGRGANGSAVVFVRGAQPIIVDNTFRDNAGNVISIDANAMAATVNPDWGRSSGPAAMYTEYESNFGPLVRKIRMINNTTNGMEVRGGLLTAETVWDDTDIAHILRSEVIVANHHVFSGLRLQSSPTASLVVKASGANAGITATGVLLDIDDRVGGTVYVLGQPGRPVVMTSLADDSVSAGVTPNNDLPLFDTNNNGASTGSPGDWRSIRFDKYSNDRNVAITNEVEPARNITVQTTNGTPATAQNLGNLAPNAVSGDENRRLGFLVYGFIALDDPTDLDVYSFKADSGTEIWIDIDKTSYGLDAMLELVDASGNVLARSLNNTNLTGNAMSLTKDDANGRDTFTTNPSDGGMRLILPGTNLKDQTYFVRVRSQSVAASATDTNRTPANVSDLTNGQSRGEYQLQIRIRQIDEKPGSTVRYADIRYATTGIEVIGMPYHSPLVSEAGETRGDNGAFGSAQDLGNLLTTDRNTISIGGAISAEGDVDWYRFQVDLEYVQAIGGFSSGGKSWATIFDLDYSDGLGRVDATLSVFNESGQLIYVGRDSNVADDQPSTAPGQGLDSDDLTRGTAGKLDPYIGSVQLPTGLTSLSSRTYYVAVTSNRRIPLALNQGFSSAAISPLARLEPIDSLRRVVEDRVNSQDGSSLAQGATNVLFNTQTPTAANNAANEIQLEKYVRPFELSDVVLYKLSGDRLTTVNPYTGGTSTDIAGGFQPGNQNIVDIHIREDGRMFGYRTQAGAANTVGQLVEIDPGTGAITPIGTDNIPDFDANNAYHSITSDAATAFAFTGSNIGGGYQLWYAITDTSGTASRLYRADPNTGVGYIQNTNIGRTGGLITGASFATVTNNLGSAASSLTLTANTPGSLAPNLPSFTFVSNGGSSAPVVTAIGPDQYQVDVFTGFTSSSVSTDFNTGGAASLTFTATAAGTLGDGIRITFTKASLAVGAQPTVSVAGRNISVVLNSNAASPSTIQQVINALQANGAVNALVTITLTGAGTTNVGVPAINPTVLTTTGGRNPTSMLDIENAINTFAGWGAVSVSAQATGTTSANVSGLGGTSPRTVTLLDGAGVNFVTTGMASLNGQLYGVGNGTGPDVNKGYFYRITPGGASMASNVIQIPGVTGLTGIERGPQNLQDGYYSNFFFLTTNTGRIICVDSSGALQTVFDTVGNDGIADASSVASNGSGAGLTFSNLDFNLWHITTRRGGDAGHGVNAAPDQSRGATQGGASWYFGLEQWTPGPSAYQASNLNNSQRGILSSSTHQELTSGTNALGNTYNLPGGAYGSLASEAFSLANYAAADKPTFYFNYFLETQNRDAFIQGSGMRDAARVFISNDGGATWTLIATNNSVLEDTDLSRDAELSTGLATSSTQNPFNSRQEVQELFDNTGSWRQARIDLSKYAGQKDLRFRFDFSTSGASADRTNTNIGVNGFGNMNSAERGQDNRREGFYVDDFVVGFAERGEMVTGSSAGVTGFFDPGQPANEGPMPAAPPLEYLAGTYQLEIRRGAEYGQVVSPVTGGLSLYQTWDTNDRLIHETRLATAQTFEDSASLPAGWTTSATTANFAWSVTNTMNDGGNRGVRSGTSNAVGTSSLQVTRVTGTGDVRFSRKVSSLAGSNFLRLYVDGVLAQTIDPATGAVTGNAEWSGDVDFSDVYVHVTAGTHTFRWAYEKTNADNSRPGTRLDAAFLDNIDFPLPQETDFTGLSVGGTTSASGYSWLTDGEKYSTLDTSALIVNQLNNNFRFSTTPSTAIQQSAWSTSTITANTGATSAKSGEIDDGQFSYMEITRDTGEGMVTFARRVSSQFGDVLFVLVDGQLADEVDPNTRQLTGNPAAWTGDLPWETVGIAVTEGVHTFRFIYLKDGAGSAGLDAAFVDDINFPNPVAGSGVIGDQNANVRDQGHIEIIGNSIFSPLQVGILVDAGARDSNGSLPYPGVVRQLPTLNNDRLAPGVVLMNNVVANYGQAGIRFSGDPQAGNDPLSVVPFGRIVNNTVYGGAAATGIGIDVTDFASPTILNNIVVNATNGIRIDVGSASLSSPPVVGANLFKGNTINGTTGSNPIFLAATDPLFVNPANRNFYLAAGSQAIDSSLNSLAERSAFKTTKNDVGIPDSPILAPDLDINGLLRRDDPSQAPPPGLGSNIFKDRGALERVDFLGPTARMLDPVDNDTNGRDRNPATTQIAIRNEVLYQFLVKLEDSGTGIDDSTVLNTNVTLLQDGVPMVEGTDYIFVYDASKDEVKLLPVSGIWAMEHTYTIVLANGATGIHDIAGNTLQTNQTNGDTSFSIFVGTLLDFGDAPDPKVASNPSGGYATLLANNGPRHLVVPGYSLGAAISEESNAKQTANASGDLEDDGLVSYILSPGLGGEIRVSLTNTPSLTAKLDGWVDLNDDGVFDASEKLIDNITLVAGVNTISTPVLSATQGLGDRFMRLRLSSTGGLTPTGYTADGEVEDYKIKITGPMFQNPGDNNPLGPNAYLDVNNDGFIAPIDALILINFINLYSGDARYLVPQNLLSGGFNLVPPPPPLPTGSFYYDPSGDNNISPIDVNLVVNYLNGTSPNPEAGSEVVGSSVTVSNSVASDSEVAQSASNVPSTLYAGPSFVVEVKNFSSSSSSSSQDDALLAYNNESSLDSFTPTLDPSAPEFAYSWSAMNTQDDESDSEDNGLLDDLALNLLSAGL
ncbi:MAG: dockerin type I domain-containing protein [Pirellulales bacterium]